MIDIAVAQESEIQELRDIVARQHNRQRLILTLMSIVTVLSLGIAIGGIILGAAFRDVQHLAHNQQVESVHRDCVTTISAARRAVFDEVDIYKAHSIQMLSDALLKSTQGGGQASADAIAQYDANNQLLTSALVTASSLPTLDQLIDHGGTIQGKHYSACPR